MRAAVSDRRPSWDCVVAAGFELLHPVSRLGEGPRMETLLTLLARLRMAVGAVSGPQISGPIAILLTLVTA